MFSICTRGRVKNEVALESSLNIKLKYMIVTTGWMLAISHGLTWYMQCDKHAQKQCSNPIHALNQLELWLFPRAAVAIGFGGEISLSCWRYCFNFFVSIFIRIIGRLVCQLFAVPIFFSSICFFVFKVSHLELGYPGAQNVPKPWIASKSTSKENSNFNL